jgi:hypothetical protein
VYAQLVELTARHGSFAGAPVVGLAEKGMRKAVHDDDCRHFAEFAGGQHVLHLADATGVAALMTDGEHASCLVAQAQHFFGLADPGCDRFFHEHVFPCAKG